MGLVILVRIHSTSRPRRVEPDKFRSWLAAEAGAYFPLQVQCSWCNWQGLELGPQSRPWANEDDTNNITARIVPRTAFEGYRYMMVPP